MKIISLILFLYSTAGLNARLIEKRINTTLTTEARASESPIRLARQVFDEDTLTGFSREDNIQSDEFIQSYNRRARHYFEDKSETVSINHRIPRDSHEATVPIIIPIDKKNATIPTARVKQNSALVKKPIPKYNDVEYDDDFQIKVSRIPERNIDSAGHEDEDFNLDDYDFDTNHDEYAGRGKPLEPRIKTKQNDENKSHQSKTETVQRIIPISPVKNLNKVVIPPTKTVPGKRAAKIQSLRKYTENDDIYEDITTKAEDETTRNVEEEYKDENEDSNEYVTKLSIRTARSPWKIHPYISKLGEKSSLIVEKVLSILPLFPQIPKKVKHV